jgi:hypothetical protein
MGGMGGMGMGGMGGMGMGMGGFRSVPPTGLPNATLKPNQTRHLPTQLVNLRGPLSDGRLPLPVKAEKLEVGEISQLTNDAWSVTALKQMAVDKAPPTVAQLVIWNVADGFDWPTIANMSNSWANKNELALARQFVERLREAQGEPLPGGESGVVYWELTTRQSDDALADRFRARLKDRTVLGLVAKVGIPAKPEGPALACRIRLEEHGTLIQLSASDPDGNAWTHVAKLPLQASDSKPWTAETLADAWAEAMLSRLADVKLIPGKKVEGKPTYRIQIDNASPLILNGLALAGLKSGAEAKPSSLAALSIPPHKGFTVPASAQMVERLGLKGGVRLIAADLSGL